MALKLKTKKNSAEFIGSGVVAIKSEKKKVYSKRQNKQVEVTERTGTMVHNGQFFKFTLSPSSDATLKDKGIGFWLEVAVFENNGENSGR